MTALTIILIIVAVIALLVVVLLIVVAMQPAEFRISRKGLINAPPAKVFAQVNDFHNWDAWSPWAKIDPAMKQTYEGPSAGKGAVYKWEGNKQVGQGRMTITESRPNELVVTLLEFMKPFVATNTTEFTFRPQGNQTEVTWSMLGKNSFMFKAMHLVMNMDKMLGKQFEQGLAQMKTAAERAEDRERHFELEGATMAAELPVKQPPHATAKKAMWWTGWVLTVLCSLSLFMSATMKFVQPKAVVEGLTKLEYPLDTLVALGIIEAVCTLIYLIPQTSVLGAVLLTGYLGGATATHVRVYDNFASPVIMGVVIWLGIYLRCGRLRAILPWRG